MRLVVNSHVRYWKPMNVLLNSMVKQGWKRWDDVVIFMGGSTRDIPPYKALHSWTPGGITIVNMTLNNYDYNGMQGLYMYRDYESVRADTYFYIHDSTSVGPHFAEIFPKLRRDFWTGELRIPRPPCSNIYTFSHTLVEIYKNNYNVNLTKGEAVSLELGGPNSGQRGARPLIFFSRRTTWLRGRQERPAADVYHTGIKRKVFWYQDFDLYKYILWGAFGDIGGDGKLRPNFR